MKVFDRFLGRGEAAVTVPPLDGGLKPNNRLEDLAPGAQATAPDMVALGQGKVIWREGAPMMTRPEAALLGFPSQHTAPAPPAGPN